MPKRPVSLDDLLRFRLAGDTQISPNGRRIAYTLKRVDIEKNKYFSSIWVADAQTGATRQYTGGSHSDSAPRWSPDGQRIAFVSDRDKPKTQIWMLPVDGGEAMPLTRLEEGGIQAPVWSPDGTRLAFLYRSIPEDRRKKVREEREEKGASSPVRVHRKLFYRLDGFGYFDESFWQVWVADAVTGDAKQLTEGPWNHGAPAWSPDSRKIAFIANRDENDDLHPTLDDIWAVSAEGGDVDKIASPAGPKFGLAWSPDGKWFSFVGTNDPDDTWGSKNERILVIPSSGASETRDLTGASDKSVGYATLADLHEVGGGSPTAWSPDSHSLYFPISEHGSTRLYTVNLNGAAIRPLTPENMEMGAFTMSPDGRRFGILIGTGVDPADPCLGVLSESGLTLTRVAESNRVLLSEIDLRMPEPFEVPNGDGGMVHGWLLKPSFMQEAKRYPCVVYVHGGPAAQYGGQAAPFHEMQWLAANGYAVVFANPRGGKGYGEAHCTAITGDWGNRDWLDVQAVADYGAALKFVDPERMAIMGGSYGGYMTAWAVGHADRFRCAITDRLVNNMHSFSGTVDFPWVHGKLFKGDAWNDPSDMWRVSPLAYAGKINTPLLIIHSDGDLRCPIEQAEQLFAALRLQGKTVEFVRYPAETSHGLSRNGPPDLRLDRLRRNLAWLDRFLKE